MMEDSAAVSACRNGSTQAFTAIYERYVDRIYAYVYAKTFDRETAEDIVSAVFMKALDRIHAFDTAKGTVQAWLYRIASNAVIDHYRRARRTVARDSIEVAENGMIEERAAGKDMLARVRKHLDALDEKKRTVITMRVWQDMSFREIADALGEKEPAVKMTFYRAVDALRRRMPLSVFMTFLLCIIRGVR